MTRYELSDLICVIASSLVIVDSDCERTPGNCYSVGSVSILAYGVLDARYRYDLTDKEASDLGDPFTIPAFEGIISLKDFEYCMFKLFQIGYTNHQR